ncbi:MAG: metallophosphoesterase [Bdellovibrionia bacterium]
MAVFRLILLVVGGIFAIYLAQQLSQFEGATFVGKLLFSIFAFSVIFMSILLPLLFWSEEGRKNVAKWAGLQRSSFYTMAFSGVLLTFVVARDVIEFLNSFFKWFPENVTYQLPITGLFIALSFFIVLLGRKRVAAGPSLKKVELAARAFGLTNRLKILQISDLHISEFVSAEFITGVVQRSMAEKPDLIMLTGDIVDGDVDLLKDKIKLLKGLSAPLGLYFVTGNHEFFWNAKKISTALEALGVHVLNNSWRELQFQNDSIVIAGVEDPMARFGGGVGPSFADFKTLQQKEAFKILLAHQPQVADEAAKHGFHLQLSGHTHGGQFFPWNLLIGFAQKYSRGLYRVDSMYLYVNQGTAFWGPDIRHGTECEISVIQIQ